MDSSKNFENEINYLFSKNIKNRKFYLDLIFYFSILISLLPAAYYFISYRNVDKIPFTTDIQLYFSGAIFCFSFFIIFILLSFFLWILKFKAISNLHPDYKLFIKKFRYRLCHSEKNINEFINFFDRQDKSMIDNFIKYGKVKSRKCKINFNKIKD